MLKKYYDYDDVEYKEIRNVESLFNQTTDEDFYKPIRTISVFDNKINYIEYESRGDKDQKFYQLKIILIWSDHI